jgi:hypothetical protein
VTTALRDVTALAPVAIDLARERASLVASAVAVAVVTVLAFTAASMTFGGESLSLTLWGMPVFAFLFALGALVYRKPDATLRPSPPERVESTLVAVLFVELMLALGCGTLVAYSLTALQQPDESFSKVARLLIMGTGSGLVAIVLHARCTLAWFVLLARGAVTGQHVSVSDAFARARGRLGAPLAATVLPLVPVLAIALDPARYAPGASFAVLGSDQLGYGLLLALVTGAAVVHALLAVAALRVIEEPG